MSILPTMVATKIVFYLGLVNLATALLLLGSCRCVAGIKSLGLGKYAAYRQFMKYHCYLWWVLWPSVAVHAFLAISVLGVHF